MKKWLLGWFSAGLCSLLIGVFSVSAFTAVTLLDTQQVVAQDDDEDAGGGAPTATASKESFLYWVYKSLGPLYSFVFLAISFFLVALSFKYGMALRRDQYIPPGLAEQFEGLLSERRFQEAYEMTKNDESFLGQVLSAGLAKLASGYDKSMQAMEETTDNLSMTTEHGISLIGLIAATSTMIGLLGTVHGMIMSFNVIAQLTTPPKPNELAGGISTAMFTTIVGLILSIPATIVYTIYRNRHQRLVFDVSLLSEDLIGKVLALAQKK